MPFSAKKAEVRQAGSKRNYLGQSKCISSKLSSGLEQEACKNLMPSSFEVVWRKP